MNISLHQTTMQISKMADIGRHSKSNPLHHPLPTPKTYATRSAQLIPLELRGSGLGEGPLTFTTVSDPLAHFPSREFIERRFRVRGVSIAGRRTRQILQRLRCDIDIQAGHSNHYVNSRNLSLRNHQGF